MVLVLVITAVVIVAVVTTVLIVRSTKNKRKFAQREIDNLRKLVNESQSPNRLPAYKEQAWQLWARSIGKAQADDAKSVIDDINRRLNEWMSIELDDAMHAALKHNERKTESTENPVHEVKPADPKPFKKKWRHKPGFKNERPR